MKQQLFNYYLSKNTFCLHYSVQPLVLSYNILNLESLFFFFTWEFQEAVPMVATFFWRTGSMVLGKESHPNAPKESSVGVTRMFFSDDGLASS